MQRLAISFLLVLLLLAAGPALAAPSLVLEERTHDFGEVTQGDQLNYVFRFHNSGDQILEIGQLQSSCGCTAALLSARRLAPGMVGELQVSFDSHGFRGRVQKHVSFVTNDPQHPSITVAVQALVKTELSVFPQRVNWGRVKAGTFLHEEISVVNDSDQAIVFDPPTTTIEGLSANLSSLTVKSGEKVSLEITAKFPQVGKRLYGYVIIHSDFPTVPELKVPVSARLSAQ